MLVLCGVAVLDLLFLEKQINEGLTVSDLDNSVLEMRRYEKNLFLYPGSEAFAETDAFAAAALGHLRRQRPELVAMASVQDLDTLEHALADYRHLLSQWQNSDGKSKKLESAIRERGQQISASMEKYAHFERKSLSATVRNSRWWLLISILIVGFLVILVGTWLVSAVTTPLRHLESNLMPIAQGHFDHLEAGSKDREFVAFTDAFNRMLKELENRRRRMLQSEKLASLGTLAAGVAHELNNPLSNISSSCQLLLEELESASAKQLKTWLKQIDSETERARRIVLALLDYGRQQELDLQPVRLTSVIEKTRLLLGNPMRNKGVSLLVEVPEDLRVRADTQRLQQVFINLLRNAMDAGVGNTNIRIKASGCAKLLPPLPDNAEVLGDPNGYQVHGKSYTQIVVEDNGSGISADSLANIFDPFYTTREPGHGMGLGLYITQEIIMEHQGCIAVTSSADEGTRFFLRLPCEGEQ